MLENFRANVLDGTAETIFRKLRQSERLRKSLDAFGYDRVVFGNLGFVRIKLAPQWPYRAFPS